MFKTTCRQSTALICLAAHKLLSDYACACAVSLQGGVAQQAKVWGGPRSSPALAPSLQACTTKAVVC
eukprot:6188717-Pleurochrysis_carterae.AAC.3